MSYPLLLYAHRKRLLLQEVLIDDNLDTMVVHSELQRSATQQFAIDSNRDVRCRLYADMATTIVDTVSNTIHRTIEEAVEAEQQMPPMERFNQSNIEHTVVGNSTWQKLEASTVILTDTDSGTIKQVVMYQLTINPHLDARRTIAEIVVDEALEIEVASLLTLALIVFVAASNTRIEAHTRNISHITRLCIVRLLVGYLTHILKEGSSLADGTYSLRIAGRYAEHTNPVVARTHSDNSYGNLLGGDHLLDEQTVDNLVQSTITTDDDDAAVALIDSLHSELGNVSLILREDQLIVDIVVAKQLGNLWQVLQATTTTCYGIDDSKPLI